MVTPFDLEGPNLPWVGSFGPRKSKPIVVGPNGPFGGGGPGMARMVPGGLRPGGLRPGGHENSYFSASQWGRGTEKEENLKLFHICSLSFKSPH